MSWLTKAWAWLRRWGGWVLGGLGVVLGAGWLWRRQAQSRDDALREAEVDRARNEVARVEGRREEMARLHGEADERVKAVDLRLKGQKRRLLRLAEGSDRRDLTDEEVAEKLKDLGY